MTNREFYQAVINANINEDMNAYAQSLIEKLDKKNENRKPTKNQQANAEYKDDIRENLADGEIHTTKMVTDYLNDKYPDLTNPLTTQKISALMGQLAKSGELEIIDKFKDTKGNRVKGYRLITAETVEETEDEVERTEDEVE